MPIITVNNLVKSFKVFEKEHGIAGSFKSFFNRKYHEVKAVDNISFNIEEGELVGFIGPNGAGKTTTLKCLSGLLYPTSGQIVVNGYNPYERKESYLKNIALVMGQKNQMWWDLPPIDSFILNKEIYEVSDSEFNKTLKELIEILDIKEILKTQVRKLSLGQRMKCELVAALIHTPKVLFLDEPTIGLDVVMQKKLRDFISSYNSRFKSTIILTSHNMEDVSKLCKRVIIIDKGKLIFDGNLSQIIENFKGGKTITIILETELNRNQIEEISSFGEIKEYIFPKLVLNTIREKTNFTVSTLLDKFPIFDINVEEPPLEDIIRDIFTGGNQENSKSASVTNS